jgi:hypothetical protein
MNIVFTILLISLVGQNAEGVERGVSITPHLEALDRTDAFDFAKAVGTSVDVGPGNVHVEEVDQVPPPQVALELHGAFHACELILDLHMLVMDADTFIIGVLDAVLLDKGDITLYVAGIIVLAMTRVQSERMNLIGEIRRKIVFQELILIAALPPHATLLRSHHFPRAEIDDLLVRGVVKQGSATEHMLEGQFGHQALAFALHCCLVSWRAKIQWLRGGRIGGGNRCSRDTGGGCPGGVDGAHIGAAVVSRRTTEG